jgi:hypothetical protein
MSLSGEYPANERTQPAWGSSLYSLGADPTENTASNSFSIVVIGGCLAITRILLTCLPAATKQPDRCTATVLHATIVFLDVIPRSFVHRHRGFGGTFCFRFYSFTSQKQICFIFRQSSHCTWGGGGRGSYRWDISIYTSWLDGVEICFTLRLPYPTVKWSWPTLEMRLVWPRARLYEVKRV